MITFLCDRCGEQCKHDGGLLQYRMDSPRCGQSDQLKVTEPSIWSALDLCMPCVAAFKDYLRAPARPGNREGK